MVSLKGIEDGIENIIENGIIDIIEIVHCSSNKYYYYNKNNNYNSNCN